MKIARLHEEPAEGKKTVLVPDLSWRFARGDGKICRWVQDEDGKWRVDGFIQRSDTMYDSDGTEVTDFHWIDPVTERRARPRLKAVELKAAYYDIRAWMTEDEFEAWPSSVYGTPARKVTITLIAPDKRVVTLHGARVSQFEHHPRGVLVKLDVDGVEVVGTAAH